MYKILKDCQKCNKKFQTDEYGLVPIENHFDYGYDENDLQFICKCPYCGEINELSIAERNLLSLKTMKLLMEKYALCSNLIKRRWEIENEEEKLIKKLTILLEEKSELNNRITLAMQNPNKDYLYYHWPLTSEVLKIEQQKRKKLEIEKK